MWILKLKYQIWPEYRPHKRRRVFSLRGLWHLMTHDIGMRQYNKDGWLELIELHEPKDKIKVRQSQK